MGFNSVFKGVKDVRIFFNFQENASTGKKKITIKHDEI